MNRRKLIFGILYQKYVWFGILIAFIMLILLSSCGTSKTMRTGISDPVIKTDKEIKASRRIEQQLREEYKLWEGTDHKMGGLDTKGVDCSGFVKVVYQKLFDITLPRTTKTQVASGRHAKRNQLKAGDLVFFKPPFFARHVGIYLSNDEFVHASKSKGVTISQISPVYWSKYYWTARRILPD